MSADQRCAIVIVGMILFFFCYITYKFGESDLAESKTKAETAKITAFSSSIAQVEITSPSGEKTTILFKQ